jgi:hypothetical protein
MSKDREIEILQHKIADLDIKIVNVKKHNISNKKIENLEILKLKYEDRLLEIENA